MKVKRFFAPDMHNAMRLVRDQVGPDAVIISNTRVAGGVEVVVALEYESAPAGLQDLERRHRKERQISALTTSRSDSGNAPAATTPAAQRRSGTRAPVRPLSPDRSLRQELGRTRTRLAEAKSREPDGEPPLLRAVKDRQLSLDDESLDQVLAALEKRQSAPRAPRGGEASGSAAAVERTGAVAPPASADGATLEAMQAEIANLKRLLSQQLQSTRAAGEPRTPATGGGVLAQLDRRLLQLGLAGGVRRQLLQGVEPGCSVSEGWRSVLARLADALPTVGEDLIERGGLIAFIGPTGVGKTTTIGKLAARYVLKHGSSGIALVTTDSYRIAAHEQLRTFGRILDIPVRVVDEGRSLDEALHGLRDKRLVLIDTAGMGGGSVQTREQVAMLEGSSFRLKKLMVLSCASQYPVLKGSYEQFKGLGLHGCILSKLDECASLGEAVSVVVEGRLPVAYLTDGQRIPEHLELAQSKALVSRSVLVAQERLKQQAGQGRESAEGRVAGDAGWAG